MITTIISILLALFSLTTPNDIDAVLYELTPEEFVELYDQEVVINSSREVLYHQNNKLIGSEIEVEENVYSLEDFIGYKWTVGDIEYAAMLAWSEGGLLGEPGMISTLSTVYTRFVTNAWCESYYCSDNMLEEMVRPNQFLGPEYVIRSSRTPQDIPQEAYVAVYKFILGLTPTFHYSSDNQVRLDPNFSEPCYGYEYFNSSPGGPADCKIQSQDGRWFLEFYNTEELKSDLQNNNFRNIDNLDSIRLYIR